MRIRIRLATAGIALVLASVGAAAPRDATPPVTSVTTIDRDAALRDFRAAYPKAAIDRGPARIRRVYGTRFSHGTTPLASADAFVRSHAEMFGVRAAELVAPAGPPAAARHTQPVMYDRNTGQYKFTAVHFEQERGGVPVFRTRMTVLVRNEPGHPVVLVNPDVRDLGAFRVDPVLWTKAVDAPDPPAARTRLGLGADVASRSMVIWAGVGNDRATPRLAERCEVIVDGTDPWLLLIDAETGAVLHEEHLVIDFGTTGQVSGLVTQGVGAQQCEEEAETPLPYVLVDINGFGIYADENGIFDIVTVTGGDAPLEAWLEGPWFTIYQGQRYVYETKHSLFETFDLPGDVSLVFNAANDDKIVRAMVNAYEAANRVRDFALRYNPDYPGVDHHDFPVNIVEGSCGTFAWASSLTRPAIHLDPGCAFSSVVFHEYGHGLNYFAGTAGYQGEYGEGMADTMSALVLDDPAEGLGVFGDCYPVRNADNDCQYRESGCSTCGSQIHACGQLLSGSIWSVREELGRTHPDEALDIISNITVNSILLHRSPRIDPSLVIDFLTLDDDNGDLSDGTPHFDEIAAGFGAHGLFLPFEFSLPDGVPQLVLPYGGDTIRVDVTGTGDLPQPSAVDLHVSTTGEPGTFTPIPMTQIEPGRYEAAFPAAVCPETTALSFYFSAVPAVSAQTQRYPSYHAFWTRVAFDTTTVFEDDFDWFQGWRVVDGDDLIRGRWDRDWPSSNDVGGPTETADGSTRCFLTSWYSDVDGGATFLYSPVLDARGVNPTIVFDRWFYSDGGPDDLDLFAVLLSNDSGTTWVPVETIGTGDLTARGGWIHREIAVADYVAPTDAVMVSFIVSDAEPDSTVEGAVDGFQLNLVTCPCRADLDVDGDVGFGDLMQLLARWGSCDGCPEDLGGDDAVGPGDLTELLAAWGPCAVTPGQ